MIANGSGWNEYQLFNEFIQSISVWHIAEFGRLSLKTNSSRATGHLIEKIYHGSGEYHLQEHHLSFQKMPILSVLVGG